MVVNHHRVAKNRTLVLCKSNKCSKLLSDLTSPSNVLINEYIEMDSICLSSVSKSLAARTLKEPILIFLPKILSPYVISCMHVGQEMCMHLSHFACMSELYVNSSVLS